MPRRPTGALALPTPEYDGKTLAYLYYLRLRKSRLIRGIISLLGGALTYLVLGRIRKRRPASDRPIPRAAVAMVVSFLLLFLLLSIQC